MAGLKTVDDLITGEPLKGKVVLVRVDLNVPVHQGKVSDFTRINRILPGIEALVAQKAKVVLMSHFGRPGGKVVRDLSLAPIADALGQAMGGREIKFAVECVGTLAESAVAGLQDGEILLLENLRFHKEEKANDKEFAQQLAALGDFYINDAFSCSHRADASIIGVAKFLPAFAGRLLTEEVKSLSQHLDNPDLPVGVMVGGAKVSTKIELLENMVTKVNYLFIGGGMANTFLYAQGKKVGKSLYEKDFKKTVQKIMDSAKQHNCVVNLPYDVVTAPELTESPPCNVISDSTVGKDEMILDIGPKTCFEWSGRLTQCRTVVWNGPLGAFEYCPFDTGTITMARVVAERTAAGDLKSVAGGGDVLSALTKAGLRGKFTYISTAGGAFLEWLQGKELPGVKVLA